MAVHIIEEPATSLADYARIPISFTVHSVYDVHEVHEPALHFQLIERKLDEPYVKDYDAYAGCAPEFWEKTMDVSKWGFLAAYIDGVRVGGAAIAVDTPGIHMLEGRNDLAVLWDIRVAPEARGRGVGSALFAAVERWAIERGCRELKIETQNINVDACRFYASMGCTLRSIDRNAYPMLLEEVMLLWGKLLTPPAIEGSVVT